MKGASPKPRVLRADPPCRDCGKPIHYTYSGPIEGICGRCTDKRRGRGGGCGLTSGPWSWGSARRLACGESLGGEQIVLQRAAVVCGRLIDPSGRPAARARVGGVDHPFSRDPERVPHDLTDADGRFRMTGVDPRRPFWLFVEHREWIARPCPLGVLQGAAVAWLVDQQLEPNTKAEVRIEFVPADETLGASIDGGKKVRVTAGGFRITLSSGAHRCRLSDGRDEVVRRVDIRIEPHAREHSVTIRLDDGPSQAAE